MRNVVNISLPTTMVKIVEKEVKHGSYSSKSEFFRMLVRLWMEKKLFEELEESRKELQTRKGKHLKSFKDLRSC
jgi:Arc/MetJ-type ribon-helix-helix transcriptional regulator